MPRERRDSYDSFDDENPSDKEDEDKAVVKAPGDGRQGPSHGGVQSRDGHGPTSEEGRQRRRHKNDDDGCDRQKRTRARSRSLSRSPRRHGHSRTRSRSRSRERGERHKRPRSRRSRSRSRSRSPRRARSRSRSPRRARSRSRSPRRARRRSRSRSKERNGSKHTHKHKKDKKDKKKDKKAKHANKRKEKEERKEVKELLAASNPLEGTGYTDLNNPFNDSNLSNQFSWRKKKEKEKDNLGLSSKEVRHLMEKRKVENMREIEKMRDYRKQRELEMQQKEEEEAAARRERDQEYFDAWEAKENSFYLEQAKMRSKIRMQDGRSKPIDMLAKYRHSLEAEITEEDLATYSELELLEPYKIVQSLQEEDAEDLLADIQVYVSLEKETDSAGDSVFWPDIMTICKDVVEHRQKQRGNAVAQRQAINLSVSAEVHAVLYGKTLAEILTMEIGIMGKLKAGGNIDVSYWESLLQTMRLLAATQRLKESHRGHLTRKLKKLKAMEMEQLHGARAVTMAAKSTLKVEDDDEDIFGADDLVDDTVTAPAQDVDLVDEEGLNLEENASAEEVNTSGMSPRLIPYDSWDEEELKRLEPLDPAQDARQLAEKRLEIKASLANTTEAPASKGEVDLLSELNEDADPSFDVRMKLQSEHYAWADKYRPRKPRYMNRVHTGFEWNHHNRVHYDYDNPPPKTVHGYKFNIFFPDLIDRTQTPEFWKESIPGIKDMEIIRFHAGPPYEDIAFKIVKRDWEMATKRGFRCKYDRGVFQLWFRFKRNFYRR